MAVIVIIVVSFVDLPFLKDLFEPDFTPVGMAK
jgi:hypothetical protein